MKAIKIYKIRWNLDGVAPEDKAKVLDSLPKVVDVKVKDNFDICSKAPILLEKQFGYKVIDFSFNKYRIVESVDELLKMCAPKDEKVKNIFTERGKLSSFGSRCKENWHQIIKNRIKLEEQKHDPDTYPILMDEVILSMEKITGLEWNDNPNEVVQDIIFQIRRRNDNCGFDSDYEAELSAGIDMD